MARVALIGVNSIGYVRILIGIWNSGDCAVLIDPGTPLYTAIQMMRDADVKKCYLQENCWGDELLDCPEIIFVKYHIDGPTTFLLPDDIYEEFKPDYSKSEAVIIYSSGTTGQAKGIILTHFAINTNADAIIDYMNPSSVTDCIYTARPLSHSSTLTGELLIALKTRTKMVITGSAILPRIILSAVEKYDVTILCLNPSLLTLVCDEIRRKAYNITRLKKVYVSGAVLSNTIYKKAREVLVNTSLFNVYGLSEAAPRVAAQTPECCKGNSVGKPIKGVEVIIVDENGNPVPIGMRGIIHVKTPSIFSGYILGNRKHVSSYKDWLNTGDIGYFDEFNELYVVDRVDDVIICNAHKVYPSDVEKITMQDSAISDCAVSKCLVNGIETIGCLYVSRKDCATDIVHRLKKLLMQHEIPQKYMRVESIPRNGRGKIDRKAIADILSGENKL